MLASPAHLLRTVRPFFQKKSFALHFFSEQQPPLAYVLVPLPVYVER